MGREKSIREMEELLVKLGSLRIKKNALEQILGLIRDKKYDAARELLLFYKSNLKE